MEKTFSFYTTPLKSTNGHFHQPTKLVDFLDGIRDGKWKTQVEAVRNGAAKDGLPYVVLSAIMADGKRAKTAAIEHSGLLQIDIDGKDNPDKTAAQIKAMIQHDKYLYAVFYSPSGTGVKAVANIPKSIDGHGASFIDLEAYFLTIYRLKIDISCKDISRAFFVSYDPEIIINENAIIKQLEPATSLPKQTTLKPQVTKLPSSKNTNNTETEHEMRLRHIEILCSMVESNGNDITSSYDNFIKIGFAVNDGLGEPGREYYHRLCRFHPEYDSQKTDKQYDVCKTPGLIKWPTLLQIAKDNGIILFSTKAPILIPCTTPKKVDAAVESVKFWKVIYSHSKDEKIFKGIEVDDLNLLKLLKSFGFRRYDLEGGFSFVHVKDNIVREVQLQNVQDAFSIHLKTLPEKIDKHVTRDDLESLIIKKSETLFGKQRLSFLTVDEPINFNKDIKNESFVYYKNGFVKCIPGSISFHQYSNLQKFIWKAQLKERDFTHLPNNEDSCFYEKFIWNISGKDLGRFSSLMTLIGYLLHDYKEAKLKAVVLTDSKLSDGNNGRTGKTLFGKAIEQIRDVCELNGKEFKADKSFKYQEAKLSTQIIFLNDAMTRFNLETIYNDITEGITIEKKNQNPVKLKVKYLITTNATIKTNGASGKDRIIEYEFADHYSDTYHPKDEFGHWFFTDWDKAEWNRFDNFMMNCIALFLENGIINSDPVNLQNRKLIDQTCKHFFDFVEAGKIMSGVKFCLQTLCEDFCAIYPDYDFRSKYPVQKFAKWLKTLPEHHLKFLGMDCAFLSKSDGNQFYIFQSNPLVLKI